RPRNIRGGILSPNANSKPAEQCATACAAFILPHSRSLCGLSCAIRSLTSSTLVASKRFFMRNCLLRSNTSQPSAPEHVARRPLSASDCADDEKRLRTRCDGIRQRRIRLLQRIIIGASEEAQNRPTLLRDVNTDGAAQHRVLRVECSEDR